MNLLEKQIFQNFQFYSNCHGNKWQQTFFLSDLSSLIMFETWVQDSISANSGIHHLRTEY